MNFMIKDQRLTNEILQLIAFLYIMRALNQWQTVLGEGEEEFLVSITISVHFHKLLLYF